MLSYGVQQLSLLPGIVSIYSVKQSDVRDSDL